MAQRVSAILLVVLSFHCWSYAFAEGLAPAKLCEMAVRRIANRSVVPENLLRSITLVETGRIIDGELSSWPWTINYGGKGYWFGTSAEAIKYATELRSKGIENFDIGCFQINLRWHPDAFPSIEDALDPIENTSYAVDFLNSLQKIYVNYPDTVSAFHSKNATAGEKYLTKVHAALASIEKDTLILDSSTRQYDQNKSRHFPISISKEISAGPSLFPESYSHRPLINMDP